MADTRIKGVDISAWQEGIPFDKIKEVGIDFVIIRAGCGKKKDSQLDKFVKECEKYGIKYGFYWYSYALTVERAKEEAEACLSVIKPYKPDYPIYFDIEDKSQITELNTRTRTDMVHAFCGAVRAAGYAAGVYANPSWFNCYLYKQEIINEYEIWLAHWTEDPNKPTRYNYNQKVWQWGLDQIADYNVDGDLSFCDYALSGAEQNNVLTDPVNIIEMCDTVYFKGGKHYISSTATKPTGGTRSAGLATVQVIAPDAPHKYALKGNPGGSNVYGWVDADLVEPAESVTTFNLGDKVMVKPGAKDYKGRSLASFVHKMVYSVMQIGCGVAPDYIVIGINGQVTAAVKAEDLIKQ